MYKVEKDQGTIKYDYVPDEDESYAEAYINLPSGHLYRRKGIFIGSRDDGTPTIIYLGLENTNEKEKLFNILDKDLHDETMQDMDKKILDLQYEKHQLDEENFSLKCRYYPKK